MYSNLQGWSLSLFGRLYPGWIGCWILVLAHCSQMFASWLVLFVNNNNFKFIASVFEALFTNTLKPYSPVPPNKKSLVGLVAEVQ